MNAADRCFREALKRVYAELYKNKPNTEELKKIENMEKEILSLMNISRIEGLLALEDKVLENAENPRYNDLSQMLMLIVDGTEAELVFEIGMNRYFANQYQGVDALVYLIMLRGVLGIQEGLNPMILVDLLDAMVPEYLEVHMTNEALENEGIIKSDEFYRKRIEKMTGKDAPYIPDEKKKGSLSGQLEISFSQMEDLYVKRLLKEFDYCELAVFLKGSTGYIRKRVFENLSKKKANMIILEMEDKRSPSIREMEEVQNKVIKTLLNLHDMSEIAIQNTNELKLMYDIQLSTDEQKAVLREKYKSIKEIVDRLYKEEQFMGYKW